MSISAVMIDNREPTWIKDLKFGGAPVLHTILDAGDVWVATDDNKMLVVERKAPTDFLGTLKDERLFVQAAGLAELRQQGHWPYVVITGDLTRGPDGNVVADGRITHWSWPAVQGAILTLQELGIFVTHCAGDVDFEACVLRLANRDRSTKMDVPPVRLGKVLGLQAGFLCGLPGIGVEKVGPILDHCGTPAWALVALTDATTKLPGVGDGIKNNIRHVLGLLNNQQIGIVTNEMGDEVLTVLPLGEQ